MLAFVLKILIKELNNTYIGLVKCLNVRFI